MNEFTARKLGEVLAFTDAGLEFWNKAGQALQSVFVEEKVAEISENLKSQKDSIHTIADRAKVFPAVMSRLESVGEELAEMQAKALGDGWGNIDKLLDWLCLFEGAASARSAVLQGAAEEMGHPELKAVADQSFLLHKNLLEEILELLHTEGRNKARE